MEYNGVDVSELQGEVNWRNVSSHGIKFAMIRATYGSSGTDSQFINNMNNILKTDIYFGAYHQSNAQSINEAIDEANYFLNTIKPYNFNYPLALRIESEISTQKGKEFFTDIILTFLNFIRQNRYYPLLYTNMNMLNEFIDINRLAGTDIWLQALTSDSNINRGPRPTLNLEPSYNNNVTMWQYSDRGSIPGIAGNANLDLSFVNYPAVIKQRGLNYLNGNNDSTNINVNDNSDNDNNENKEPDFLEPDFYTVEKGDTLRGIAKKIFGDAEQYRKLMELNGLNRPIIFAGQTLRIPQTVNANTMLYRVIPGDTLWKLAERFLGYGPRYNEIISLNGLTTDMIYPGQILKIPAESENFPQVYTVKEGDTLWKIAREYLNDGNRYTEIMKLNNLKSGNLRMGQILSIPQK